MSNFEKSFKKENILEKTKNSVNNLINYNSKFKNNIQYPGEPLDDLKIKQLLLPVYDKIYEIKEDLLIFSELNSQNNQKNISTKQFNEIQHLHTNMLYNKNLIDDTLNYMKEKIENVNYEQINKEFEEISFALQNLKKEMEDMVEEFNMKYEKILKEKKRQKIAKELMNGTYNKVSEEKRYKPFNKENSMKFENDLKYGEDNMDYNKYKNDIDEINSEKENLMIKYLEEKQKVINNLPQLVPPYQKVNFNYNEINQQNFDNKNNNINNNYENNNIRYINNNINNIKNKSQQSLESQKNENDNNISINDNNINNNINNDLFSKNYSKIANDPNMANNEGNDNKDNISNSTDKLKEIIFKSKIKESQNSNQLNNKQNNFLPTIDYSNPINSKDQKSPTEKNDTNNIEILNNFKEKMAQASKEILTGPTNPKTNNYNYNNNKKSFQIKETYDYNQPKSNNSKITYQTFAKPKQRQKFVENKYRKKNYKYYTGKYPDENEKNRMNDFIKNNPSRPPNDNLKIFNQQNMEEEIRKIVEINVKKVLDSLKLNQNNMESSSHRRNKYENTGINDDLVKILIQKFNDIENAIRETKINNKNDIEYPENINELFAEAIASKIKMERKNKIKKKIIEESEEEEEEEEEKQPPPKKEEPKIVEQKNINVLDDDSKIDMKDLDDVIPAPRDLNLYKYKDISLTSEDISESLKRKPNLKMNENKIEITNINIKKQQDFYQNNNYNNMNNFKNKNQSENSLSEGESRTITGESESDFNKKNKFNTANNFMPNNINKNRTGNDLMMLKYYNENLPEFNFNNRNYIKYNNNFNNENEIDLNKKPIMKKNDMFDKDEYTSFKDNYLLKMNKNKTLTNFESMSNPYNQYNLDEDTKLKIIKPDENDFENIQQKINQLKIKNQLDENNNININTNINNYFNNNINNFQENEEGDEANYSPGEARSEDSY